MIKNAIIPVAGLGTRFLPLSKVLPKELWPLADKPIIRYIVEEAANSSIEKVTFVVNPNQKLVLDYFKQNPELIEFLKRRKKGQVLKELDKLQQTIQGLSFLSVCQKQPLGDGHAILQAQGSVNKEPSAVLFCDDIVESKMPCLKQLIKVFKTCQKPVVALYRLPREELSSYGVVKVEKIASRLYKIKEIVEKPPLEEVPSDLVIVGKYIITPDVFDYLGRITPNKKGEIILAEALRAMVNNGKAVYGYEFEGQWHQCGNKLAYLRSNIYYTLHHPEFGPDLKNFAKKALG